MVDVAVSGRLCHFLSFAVENERILSHQPDWGEIHLNVTVGGAVSEPQPTGGTHNFSSSHCSMKWINSVSPSET